jgi:plasmid stability protein
MPDILIRNIEVTDYKKIQEKASELGLSANAYIRQVLKNSLKKFAKQEPADTLKAARALVPVLAEALGRTQNANPEAIEKLAKILLKKFDQEAGSGH